MKTTIYWAVQHSCQAVHEFRFRASCWWLRQHVEFLEWRLQLEALTPPARSSPMPTSVGQKGSYAVHSM
jgi:hypothetical protein